MCAYIFNTLQATRLMLYWDSYDVIKSTHKKYYGHIHLNITTLTNYVPGRRCRNRLTLKSILGHTDRQTYIRSSYVSDFAESLLPINEMYHFYLNKVRESQRRK